MYTSYTLPLLLPKLYTLHSSHLNQQLVTVRLTVMGL